MGSAMDLVVSVVIVIAGIFSLPVVDPVVGVTPRLQVVVNAVLIGINLRTDRHGSLHQGRNRRPLHVGQHV